MAKRAKSGPAHRNHRKSIAASRNSRARVPTRQPAPRFSLTIVRSLKNARTVREWLGFSLEETGQELARLMKREFPFTRQAVSKMEQGHMRIGEEVLRAYGQLVANRLTAIMDQTVGITIEANSPWRIIPWMACRKCGNWFSLSRSNQRHCSACIARRS